MRWMSLAVGLFVGCEVVARSGFVGLGIWITPCLSDVEAFSEPIMLLVKCLL